MYHTTAIEDIIPLNMVLTSPSTTVPIDKVPVGSYSLWPSSSFFFPIEPGCLVLWRVFEIWYLWRCLNAWRLCHVGGEGDAVSKQNNIAVIIIIIIPKVPLEWSETTIVSESKMEAIVVRWGCGRELTGPLLSCFSCSELLSTTTVYVLISGLWSSRVR